MKAALCNGTSVLSQPQPHHPPSRPHQDDDRRGHPTLEQMILQLEVEEELARKSKLLSSSSSTAAAHRDNFSHENVERGRMSCVTSSDVLRSARNALSQYPPRFSLDGKDAMYRSSFHRSVCVGGLKPGKGRTSTNGGAAAAATATCLPRWLGGQMVVWCEAGVVAKLMGLEKVPVVVRRRKAAVRDVEGDKIIGRNRLVGHDMNHHHKVVAKKKEYCCRDEGTLCQVRRRN